MRVGRRSLLASALATVAAPAILRMARADAPLVLKLHHAQSSVSSTHDKFLVPWARKVEADAGGRIRIDIFPSMQLGGAPSHLFDQARDGDVDIAWAAPRLTPGRFPRIEMFELPFVPSRRALVSSKALEDFAAANLKDEFREVHPIAFSCSDRGVIHANQPIRTIEDIKDLKLHVQTRFAGEALRVLGAHAVPMPSGQLPMAIAVHVVDGCIDPWHMVPTLRLNDLLKTHTEFSDLSMSSTSFVLAMNKPLYDRLPRDLKAVIDANSRQVAAGLAGTMWDLQAAAVTDMVAKRGDTIVTLLPEAVAHWRKATEPVVDIWLKEMKEQKVDGSKLLASARALFAKYSSLPEPQPPQAPPAEQQAVTETPARPDAKASPGPAPNAAPASPSTSPTSLAKPAQPAVSAIKPAPPPPAPAPHAATAVPATPPPAPAPPPHGATPAAPPPAPHAAAPPPPAPHAAASPAPVVKPVPAPSAAVAATPPPPAVTPAPTPAPAAPAAPPVKLVPKTIDIPL